MDTHLIVKIIHMSSAALAMLVFVLRAFTLFVGTQNQQPNPKGRVAFVAVQHFSYTLLVITGVALLVMNHFQVQTWFYAKILLFFVLLSSQIKAYKKDEAILLAQRRAGLVLGAIAFVSILALILIKPVFG
ncbi:MULTISPECIES: SirB2 family protein [unclassified Acinetobacter]|uniref:SirB2 family protein n=1 Tax=Acinetobacter TaxID=469 RepID=UPI0025752A23|nr:MULTISPECIES: SirB2 family protein [unclassified Acinetobacter]MDM1757701.1 SirB2 family protein [Acinetobacter sp. 256-1]MDM1762128.1 SirB2 family protein [Acinetobacter sp. 251-1]